MSSLTELSYGLGGERITYSSYIKDRSQISTCESTIDKLVYKESSFGKIICLLIYLVIATIIQFAFFGGFSDQFTIFSIIILGLPLIYLLGFVLSRPIKIYSNSIEIPVPFGESRNFSLLFPKTSVRINITNITKYNLYRLVGINNSTTAHHIFTILLDNNKEILIKTIFFSFNQLDLALRTALGKEKDQLKNKLE